MKSLLFATPDKKTAYKMWSAREGHLTIVAQINEDLLAIDLVLTGIRHLPKDGKKRWTYELADPKSVTKAKEKLTELYNFCHKVTHG